MERRAVLAHDKSTTNRALAALVFGAAFASSLLTVGLLNDHFDRISRGRQILVDGARPFADFQDPGYFLTLYTSAAAQAVSGGSLLGEAVVDSAAMAVAVALTFLLASHAGQSTAIGLVAAIFTVIVAPRYYDYDKVLFYTAGLALAWRYADTRALGPLIAAAILTVVAGLFRYDNGAFLFAVTVTTLVACHYREPLTFVRRTLTYSAFAAAALAPVAIAWSQTMGLPEVARQVYTYARVEGARTQIFALPRSQPDHTLLLYVMMVALLPVASAALVWAAYRPRRNSGLAHQTPKIAAAVVLGVLVAAFILREPVGARLGAAAPIAAIVAAWLAGALVPSPRAGYHARRLTIGLAGVAALSAALVLTERSPVDVLRAPQTTLVGLARLRELARVPPGASILPEADAIEGMVAYVRDCTPRGSRVFVAGFVPQLYFFADRSFAGGMPVTFGGHWSSVPDQERSIEQLKREFVPLAIVDADFVSTYDRVAAYLLSSFVMSGVSTFGNPQAPPGGYQVLVNGRIRATRVESRWNLPCPATATP